MRQSLEATTVFPAAGINVMSPRSRQPDGTCIDCQNVRIFDAEENRSRGGSRPGLVKYCSAQLDGSNRVQNLSYTTTVSNAAPNSGYLFRRTITAAAVCNGRIIEFNTTTATPASAVNAASTMNASAPVIFSAELFGDVFYTDGQIYSRWDAATNQFYDYEAADGSMPGDPPNTCGKLIAVWRARVVIAGVHTDPHNWFMSRLGDPYDWEYAPLVTTETQPVQGGVGETGKIGDKITALVPYSDDVMIFGCDHTIWQMSGDPQSGGRLDLVSSDTGMAWGTPWAKDQEGTLYFMGNRGGVYSMQPGGGPQHMTSTSIDPLLDGINMNTNTIHMSWDVERDGLYLFITPLTEGTTDHWFWDSKTNGWFRDRLANTAYNPVASMVYDGDDPADRVLMIGSEDGYVRYYSDTAYQDDGQAFDSYVTFGPLYNPNGHKEILLTEVQALTDLNSSAIKYEVVVGESPDGALGNLASPFVGADGTFQPGLSITHNPRKRGYYVYMKVGQNAATASWSIEFMKARISVVESGRGRQSAS